MVSRWRHWFRVRLEISFCGPNFGFGFDLGVNLNVGLGLDLAYSVLVSPCFVLYFWFVITLDRCYLVLTYFGLIYVL
jgi:hypothetical protein